MICADISRRKLSTLSSRGTSMARITNDLSILVERPMSSEYFPHHRGSECQLDFFPPKMPFFPTVRRRRLSSSKSERRPDSKKSGSHSLSADTIKHLPLSELFERSVSE